MTKKEVSITIDLGVHAVTELAIFQLPARILDLFLAFLQIQLARRVAVAETHDIVRVFDSNLNPTLTMHFNRICIFVTILWTVTSCTTSKYKPDSENGALLYDPNPSPTERAIWTGSKDSEGFASGFGRLKWLQHGRQVSEYEGTKVRGKWTSYRKLDRSEWNKGDSDTAPQSGDADPLADLVAGLMNGAGRSVQRTYGEGRWLTGTLDNMRSTVQDGFRLGAEGVVTCHHCTDGQESYESTTFLGTGQGKRPCSYCKGSRLLKDGQAYSPR